jgi:hypothetical protein
MAPDHNRATHAFTDIHQKKALVARHRRMMPQGQRPLFLHQQHWSTPDLPHQAGQVHFFCPVEVGRK